MSGIDLEPIKRAIEANVARNGRSDGSDQLTAALNELETWRSRFVAHNNAVLADEDYADSDDPDVIETWEALCALLPESK